MKQLLKVSFCLCAVQIAQASTYDVTNYGAIAGDGLSDTTAIQSALDAAASAGGGTVYIPAGTYHVENLLIGDYTTVAGDGQGTSILESPDILTGNINRLLSNAGGKNADNVCITIRDLGFRGWTDAYTASPDGKKRQGINFWRTSDVLIERCRFENLDFGVINQMACHRVTVTACSAYRIKVYGFYVSKQYFDGVDTPCSNVTYTACLVQDALGDSKSSGAAYRAFDSDYITYLGCISVNTSSRSVQTDSARHWAHIGTLVRQSGWHGFGSAASGIDGGHAPGGTSTEPSHKPFDLQLTGCVAADCQGGGFEFAGAREISLSGAISYGNQEDGVVFKASDFPETGEIPQRFSVKGSLFIGNGENGASLHGVHSGVISDSLLLNNSQSAAGSYDGIQIENGLSHASTVPSHQITVEHCLISDDQALPTQNYAVSSIEDSDHIKVFLSYVSGNLATIAPISLTGTSNMVGLNTQ